MQRAVAWRTEDLSKAMAQATAAKTPEMTAERRAANLKRMRRINKYPPILFKSISNTKQIP